MNAFETVRPRSTRTVDPIKAMSPQAAYYHRRKAGLTGSRQAPKRHWRKEIDGEYYMIDQAERDRLEIERRKA